MNDGDGAAAGPGGYDSAVVWESARDANLELWEDRAVLHEDLYDAHALAADPQAISTVIRDDVPVLLQHLAGRARMADHAGDLDEPLAGLEVLHLQCHIGTDTLSLARLGARVTGLDFSPASLDVARRLADEAGLEIAWVESDVLAARGGRVRGLRRRLHQRRHGRLAERPRYLGPPGRSAPAPGRCLLHPRRAPGPVGPGREGRHAGGGLPLLRERSRADLGRRLDVCRPRHDRPYPKLRMASFALGDHRIASRGWPGPRALRRGQVAPVVLL